MNMLHPPEKLCAFCQLRLGFVRWKTEDGKYVHRVCRGLYNASRVIGHAMNQHIPVKYTLLSTGQPQIQCDGCQKTRKMMCNAEDIKRYLMADNWEQFGDTLLCCDCTMSVRKKFYAAAT